jgi:uncharacterized protein YndB with AHSA1/START domain
MATTDFVAEPGVPQVVITREFDAPPELLFRAATEPDLVSQWLGPRRLKMRVEELNPHHGGKWRFVHMDDDGNEYAFRGVFHGTPSVDDGILQTWEWEGLPGHVSLQEMKFEPRGNKTLLHMNAVYTSVADRDGHVANGMADGVYDSMDRLAELSEKLLAAR